VWGETAHTRTHAAFSSHTSATDTIAYVATDQTGLTSTSTRTVIIQPANDNQASTTPANDNRNHVVKNVLERLSRHQIRNETGYAAFGGRCRFAIGIEWHARLRNVLAMAEMQVDIEGTRKNSEAAHGDFRSRAARPTPR
jgi:hypothetical protein